MIRRPNSARKATGAGLVEGLYAPVERVRSSLMRILIRGPPQGAVP